jgi:hypothetical protein
MLLRSVGLLLALAWPSLVSGQSPRSIAEQYLFRAANAERQARGLPVLRWDEALHQAAVWHAEQMAARASISHQYPGEPDVSERAQRAGARFSVVAENVAEAPNAVQIHDAWMRSEHHRDNLLDPHVDHIGISVLSRNGQLYAVEDFDRGVATMSFDEQESAVASLLAQENPGLGIHVGREEARATCDLDSGYAGTRRPWFVMRFTAGELDLLPEQLRTRLATGKYHEVSVGACPARGVRNFTSYNIAVLLFP